MELPSILFTFLLLHIVAVHGVVTRLGTNVPDSLLKLRLRHLHPEAFHTAVYELTTSGDLISSTHTISPLILAPDARQLEDDPVRITVDDIRHPDLVEGAFLRVGKQHTFVYASRGGQLLTVWGPNILMESLGSEKHPNIFVNVLSGKKNATLDQDVHFHSDRPPRSHDRPLIRTLEPSDMLSQTTSHQRDDFRSPFRNQHDFEIFAAYDRTFCKHQKGMHNANKVIKTLFAEIAPTFRKQAKINPTLKHIYGRCGRSETFGPPPNLNACPVDSTECSRSTIILEGFRSYWDVERDIRRRDAVYLFTGYDDGTDAIGAAYISAACNPKYAYGWIERATPVVLAHEIGHTLGAHHDEKGLMRPYLDLSETGFTISPASLASIAQFTRDTFSSWCLARWDQYYNLGKTTLVGVRMGHAGIDGTDLTIADGAVKGQVDLYTIHLDESATKISYSQTESVQIREGNYRYNEWRGLYEVKMKGGPFYGGGIAYGNIKSPSSRDLVIFVSRGWRRASYKVGFGLDAKGMIQENQWSKEFDIPVKWGVHVMSVGITVGDATGNGKNDLIVAFIDRREGENYAYYIIGKDIQKNGRASWWSEVYAIRGWLSSDTGDISVSLWDTTGSGRPDLLIHTSEKVLFEYRGNFRVGRDLDSNGKVTGIWSTSIPDPGSPLISVMPGVKGGATLGRIQGKEDPTTIVLQSVNFKEAQTAISYLEFGFDVVAAAKEDVKRSFVENVIYEAEKHCRNCYNSGSEAAICAKKFTVCEKTGHSYPIEVDVEHLSDGTSRLLNILRQDENVTETEEGYDDSIFCNGFHELFIGDEGDPCRSDSGSEEVIGEGTKTIIEDELKLQGISNVTVEVELEEEEASTVLKPGDKGWGPSRSPKSIRIIIMKYGTVREEAVREAFKTLSNKPDYTGVFQTPKATVHEGKDGKTWVVVLNFSEKFRATFYKDDLLVTYGSDAKFRRF